MPTSRSPTQNHAQFERNLCQSKFGNIKLVHDDIPSSPTCMQLMQYWNGNNILFPVDIDMFPQGGERYYRQYCGIREGGGGGCEGARVYHQVGPTQTGVLGNFIHITVRREKRAIEEFERKNRTTGGVGTLRGWITLKKESEKNRAAAVEDMRRAMEAVKVAEDKVFAIGDRLVEEERQLQAGFLNRYCNANTIRCDD